MSRTRVVRACWAGFTVLAVAVGSATGSPAVAGTPARAPVISWVTASSGPTTGDVQVLIHGRNLSRVTSVRFGNEPARAVAVVSPWTVRAVSPAHVAGSVDVRVYAGRAASGLQVHDRYRYVAAPAITQVLPATADSTTPTRVTIHGSDLLGADRVLFGSAPGTSVHVVSATTLQVTAPPQRIGPVPVAVRTPYGSSAPGPAARLTYTAAPAPVTGLTAAPVRGPVPLWWTPSGTAGAGRVVIRRLAGTVAPATVTSGSAVADVASGTSSVVDSAVATLPAGTFSYAAFAVGSGRYSAAAGASADTTVTAPVQPPPGWSGPDPIDRIDHFGQWLQNRSGQDGQMSCPAAQYCVAVDVYGNYAVLDDGTWTRPVQIDDQPFVLIDCATKTSCIAIDGARRYLRFDGSTWTAPDPIEHGAVPAPPSIVPVVLACPSEVRCVEIDRSGNVQTFDGTSWSLPTVLPGWSEPYVEEDDTLSCAGVDYCLAGDTRGSVYAFEDGVWGAPVTLDDGQPIAVSCPAARSCLAASGARSWQLAGSTWTEGPAIPGVQNLGFTDVACVTGMHCLATNATTVDAFDGTSWTYAPGARSAEIHCADESFCLLQGWLSMPEVDPVTLAYLGDPGVDQYGYLFSVSCPAGDACRSADTTAHAFASDGSSWGAPAPFPLTGDPQGIYGVGTNGTGISALSCASATTCMAVGSDYHPGAAEPAYSQDLGAGWSSPQQAVPSSQYPQFDQPFGGVSCASAAFCVATLTDGTEASLWNGTSWSAPAGIDDSTLYDPIVTDVSCVSASFCVAVDTSGGYSGSSMVYRGLGWSSATPAVGLAAGENVATGFTGVSCASTTMCVGITDAGLATVFDGTQWSAPTAVANTLLSDVSCGSASLCVALDRTGAAYVFDGKQWSGAEQIDPDGQPTAVSCGPAGECVVVDTYGNAITYRG